MGWDCKQMIIFPPAKGGDMLEQCNVSFQIAKCVCLNCKMYLHCGALCVLHCTSMHCDVHCCVLHFVTFCSECYILLHFAVCVTLCNECYTFLHFAVSVTHCYTLHWSDPWPLHEAWVLFWAAQLFWSDTPQTVGHPATRKFLT